MGGTKSNRKILGYINFTGPAGHEYFEVTVIEK
jgi:hypothetical protein